MYSEDEGDSKLNANRFSNPITYLEYTNKQCGITPGKKWDDKLSFGENFWNGVTIKPENTLFCSKCQNDTKEFSRLKSQMTLIKFNSDHAKCCKWCLWYDWFNYQRSKMI
jgi:hypothetical protein